MQNQLILQKADIYRQELRANSQLEDALGGTTKKCRWAGHKQHQVVRADSSRNYGGHKNISQKIKEEISLIERKELFPLEELINSHRSSNIAKGGRGRAPKKLLDLRDQIMGKIMVLRKSARDTDGIHGAVADHHYVTNQKFIKA